MSSAIIAKTIKVVMAELDLSGCKCTFGIISDVQYADVKDGTNFHGDRFRYFRNAAKQLQKAVTQWSVGENPVDFVLQLGDIIDGRNNKVERMNEQALATTTGILNNLKNSAAVHHLIGNHELYNFSRDKIKASPLNSSNLPNAEKPSKENMYYSFKPIEGLRFVVLATYEISVLGVSKDSDEYKEGLKMLEINTNADYNDPMGLPPQLCMRVAYNGGISDKQLKWLDQTLTQAEANNENVIVTGHQGIHESASAKSSLCWSHEEILSTLERHKSCVLAYFCGHDHDGGRCLHKGIHIVSFEAVIETTPESSAFATARVFDDKIEIEGSGRITDLTLPLKHKLINYKN